MIAATIALLGAFALLLLWVASGDAPPSDRPGGER